MIPNVPKQPSTPCPLMNCIYIYMYENHFLTVFLDFSTTNRLAIVSLIFQWHVHKHLTVAICETFWEALSPTGVALGRCSEVGAEFQDLKYIEYRVRKGMAVCLCGWWVDSQAALKLSILGKRGKVSNRARNFGFYVAMISSRYGKACCHILSKTLQKAAIRRHPGHAWRTHTHRSQVCCRQVRGWRALRGNLFGAQVPAQMPLEPLDVTVCD